MSTLIRRTSALLRHVIAWGVLGYAVFLGFADYIGRIREGGEVWRSGDWLINYGGGFIRRGLLGELILDVTPATVPATLWTVFAVQAACYALILAFVLVFLQRSRYSWGAVALACSPAGLAFMGWDPQGGFRKEIIGFAALALLGWNLHGSSARAARWRILVAIVLLSVGTFSWEATAFLLPAALVLIAQTAQLERMNRLGGALVLSVISITGAALSVAFHGDDLQVVDVCSRLVERGFDMSYCGFNTPITALGWSLQTNIDTVHNNLPYDYRFIPLALLAFLPLLSATWVRRHAMQAFVIVLPVFVLYFIAIDFGRWTHMWFMALAIVAMANRTTFSRGWNLITVALYVTLWGIPHCIIQDFTPQWPWLGLLHAATGFNPLGTPPPLY